MPPQEGEVDAATLALWAAREECVPDRVRRMQPSATDIMLSAAWSETRRQAWLALAAAEDWRKNNP